VDIQATVVLEVLVVQTLLALVVLHHPTAVVLGVVVQDLEILYLTWLVLVLAAVPAYLDKAALVKQQKLLFQIQLQLPVTAEDQAAEEAREQVLQLPDLVQQGTAAVLEAQVVEVVVRAATLATEPTAHQVLSELFSGQVQRFQQPTCFK
jgi:hypothetical protein